MTVPTPLSLQAAALNAPAVRQPSRRAGSIRRTSSLQSLWTKNDEPTYTIIGRARDLATFADRDPVVIAEDSIRVGMGGDGRLTSLTGSRLENRLERFAGLYPGGELRKAMAAAMPEEGHGETPLHRLLDDLAGAAFMSMAAWYAWDGGIEGHAARTNVLSPTERPVEGVCLSYVPGSPAMAEDGRGVDQNANHPLGPVPLSIEDPAGFHALLPNDGPNEWRLRRTDLWREGDALLVDAWFQDSTALPRDPDRRVIFHEYGIMARIDSTTLDFTDVSVTPHVLPYVTCHAAPATAKVLVGQNVRDLRQLVIARLRGTAGCTHLNDMLRALQDVAGLADSLTGQGS